MIYFFIGIAICIISILLGTINPIFIILSIIGIGLLGFGIYHWIKYGPPQQKPEKKELVCPDFYSAVSILVNKTIKAIQSQKNNIVNKSAYHVLDFSIFLIYIHYLDLTELNFDEDSQELLSNFIEIANENIINNFRELDSYENLFKFRFAEYRRILFSSRSPQRMREEISFLLLKYLTADDIDPIYSPYNTGEIAESDMDKTLSSAQKILKAQQNVYAKTVDECALLFRFLQLEN